MGRPSAGVALGRNRVRRSADRYVWQRRPFALCGIDGAADPRGQPSRRREGSGKRLASGSVLARMGRGDDQPFAGGPSVNRRNAFQFKAGNSIFHRLDPMSKLVWLFGVSLLAFGAYIAWIQIVITLAVLGTALFLARLSVSEVVRGT